MNWVWFHRSVRPAIESGSRKEKASGGGEQGEGRTLAFKGKMPIALKHLEFCK